MTNRSMRRRRSGQLRGASVRHRLWRKRSLAEKGQRTRDANELHEAKRNERDKCDETWSRPTTDDTGIARGIGKRRFLPFQKLPCRMRVKQAP